MSAVCLNLGQSKKVSSGNGLNFSQAITISNDPESGLLIVGKRNCWVPALSYVFYPFNRFPNKPWFLRVCGAKLLKTLWEKKKLLVTSNFFFSHSVFYPFIEISAIFIIFEIVVCELFQFGPV